MRKLKSDRRLNMGKSHHENYGKDYCEVNEEGPCGS